MRAPLVLFTSMIACGCSSPVADSLPTPAFEPTVAEISGCYSVHAGTAPSSDVSLPTLIELSRDPAPGFVEPGRFDVREPGSSEPRAPISSWAPGSGGTLDLSLGGGYTGYNFTLGSAERGIWTGFGAYFADIALEPKPAPLPLRLTARSCP
jgi:hypothetical protein